VKSERERVYARESEQQSETEKGTDRQRARVREGEGERDRQTEPRDPGLPDVDWGHTIRLGVSRHNQRQSEGAG
jgi:hypothetical protein